MLCHFIHNSWISSDGYMRKASKHALRLGLALLILIIIFVSFWVFFYFRSYEQADFELGVNFSQRYAEYLGLDWQETYLAILDDLQVREIRLAAPWEQIEPVKDHWVFTDLDWQVDEAVKRGADIVLVVGRRTPHWPECHDPVWLNDLPQEIVIDRQFLMIQKVIEHYKNVKHIKIWQVENEPLLNFFGLCPPADLNLLRREVSLVKTLDDRPIMITDSGELSLWTAAANTGDIFGTTMYKVIHNPWLGYAYYHLPPIFYRIKAQLAGKNPDEIIISELQAEPWAPDGLLEIPLQEQQYSMDGERLINHVKFAKKTGFKAAYLWGAEWWYWLKTEQGVDELWVTAKELFNR